MGNSMHGIEGKQFFINNNEKRKDHVLFFSFYTCTSVYYSFTNTYLPFTCTVFFVSSYQLYINLNSSLKNIIPSHFKQFFVTRFICLHIKKALKIRKSVQLKSIHKEKSKQTHAHIRDLTSI